MRIERAIDAFLDWRRLERDATPRSVDSYRRILWKLAEDYPEARLDALTTDDLRAFLEALARPERCDALERDLGPALVLRLGRGRGSDRGRPVARRSAGRRSGSRTFTGRAWTSSSGSAQPLSAARAPGDPADGRRGPPALRSPRLPVGRPRPGSRPGRAFTEGPALALAAARPGRGRRAPRELPRAAARARRLRVHGRGRAVGFAVRARAAAEGSEAAGERAGAVADGASRLQARRRSRALPAPATAWLRKPLHARERPRRSPRYRR